MLKRTMLFDVAHVVAGQRFEVATPHLVVIAKGTVFSVESAPVTVGRGGQNDLVLDGDEFASARHARIEARGDGVWVQDLDSTNGTFLNGARVVGAERMSAGDVLRVGETDLVVEED